MSHQLVTEDKETIKKQAKYPTTAQLLVHYKNRKLKQNIHNMMKQRKLAKDDGQDVSNREHSAND